MHLLASDTHLAASKFAKRSSHAVARSACPEPVAATSYASWRGVRGGGGRWPAVAWFAPVLDQTLVLDPAPALPVEFGGWAGAGWSAPLQMPEDRTEAEVTVVLPGR